MSDKSKVLVRNARDQDVPAVAEIAAEAFTPTGTVEPPETYLLRLTAFPNGFIILVADNEIAAYGCSEKWLSGREPVTDENPKPSHQPDGRIFSITSMAVKMKYRGQGYGLLVLDKLIEIAHLEGCREIVVETADARDFFLQRGFKTLRKRSGEGISFDVMSLELKSTVMK